jgi:quercetin dioxygenase-like cupin family protein
MTPEQLINTHPTGKTTGTTERPGKEHKGEALTFDINREIEQLHAEEIWRRSGRNSRTLVKQHNLRVLAVALKQGMEISEHSTSGRLAVQVLSGHLRMRVPGQEIEICRRGTLPYSTLR